MSVEDLQNKIDKKLSLLSASLDTLRDQQKALLENADRAKNCINSSSDKVFNNLKLRERLLIRQVEVVTAHQKSLLDSQISKLLQIKGSLSTTQNILQQCKPKDLETLINLYDEIKTRIRPVQALKMIAVQFDEGAFESSIEKFGKVQVPDVITHHHSPVLPSKMEDYGDSEQDILHKSIGGTSSSASTIVDEGTTIKVQFPKFLAKGWLANSEAKATPIPGHCERKLSKDVSSWLANLRVSQSEESKLSSSFDFVEDYLASPMQTTKSKSRCSSVSSSIEIVSVQGSEKGSCCLPNDDFLNSRSCWSSVAGSLEKKALPVSHMQEDMEEFACQANEPCESYDSCLCNGYCKELANERASQTSKWLLKTQMEKASGGVVEEPSVNKEAPHPTGIKRKLSPSEGSNEILKHMRFILDSDQNKWLSPTPRSKMLKVASNQDSKWISVAYKPRSDSWLSKTAISVGDKNPVRENSIIEFSPHSNIWLLHKLKEERRAENERKNRAQAQEDSLNSTDDGNSFIGSPVSVSDLKGALAELSVLIPKYAPSSNTSIKTLPVPTSTPVPPTGRGYTIVFPNFDNEVDLTRKLKWLSRSHSKNPVPGHVNIISRSHSYLPESLVALAESKLDKWLISRY